MSDIDREKLRAALNNHCEVKKKPKRDVVFILSKVTRFILMGILVLVVLAICCGIAFGFNCLLAYGLLWALTIFGVDVPITIQSVCAGAIILIVVESVVSKRITSSINNTKRKGRTYTYFS